MKTKITKEPGYTPVSLTITFETQRELDAFGVLFNYAQIMDTLRRAAGNPQITLYDKMAAAGADFCTGADAFRADLKQRLDAQKR